MFFIFNLIELWWIDCHRRDFFR